MCSERCVLLSGYSEAAGSYADSVSKMTDYAGLGIESEFNVLRRACRSAWEAAEGARLALYRHEANHGCDRSDFAEAAASAASAR